MRSGHTLASWPQLYRAIYWVALLGGFGFGAVIIAFAQTMPVNGDFRIFYAAAHALSDGVALSRLYDFSVFSTLHGQYIGVQDPMPFIYPPPFALLIEPLAMLDMSTAFLVWGIAGLASLCGGLLLMRLPGWLILVLTINPCTLLVVAYGQVETFLLLPILMSVSQLSRHAALSGSCMALLSIKPQFGLLPGLLALRHGKWAALVWGILGSILLVCGSVWLQGMEAWLSFFEAAPGFVGAAVQIDGISAGLLSPYALFSSSTVHWGAVGIAFICVYLIRRQLNQSETVFVLTCLALMAPPYLLSKALLLFLVPCCFAYGEDRSVFFASFVLATLVAPVRFSFAPMTGFPVVALVVLGALAWLVWRNRAGFLPARRSFAIERVSMMAPGFKR